MYPDGFDTRVVPGRLAGTMEGASRPGHFEGVATVVVKLFNAVRCDHACFGEKDFQQLAIIRRVVADLDLGVEIVACPTLREPDGLAMSSRNRRLNADERRAATCIPRALDAASQVARNGGDPPSIVDALRSTISAEPLASLDYATLFDPTSLAERTTLDDADRIAGRSRLAVAVRIGNVRLIDNLDPFGDRDVAQLIGDTGEQ
jgi:pantoate--beta-alanine ligase